jgi:flavin-dependent dehydrogenase
VRIAGGGLSGLAAAITLAGEGVPVEVHERGRGPGCRHHFDLQGIENWSGEDDVASNLRALGFSLDCPLYPVHELHLLARDLEDVVVRTDRPLAYLVHRGFRGGTLDDALSRQALSLGVSIRSGSTLRRDEADVWATGPPSATGIVAGYTFKTDHPFLCLCLLHEECAPGGYVYLNIAGGEGTLATVLLHRFERARDCLRRSRELLAGRFGFSMKGAVSFGGVGYFGLPGVGREGLTTVGEAGGYQDLLFGFGIHMALLTGRLAARAHLGHRGDVHRGMERVQSILKASLSNRLLFEWGGYAGHRYMIRRARKLGPRSFLSRWYRFGTAKRLVYPLARAWFGLRFGRRATLSRPTVSIPKRLGTSS